MRLSVTLTINGADHQPEIESRSRRGQPAALRRLSASAAADTTVRLLNTAE